MPRYRLFVTRISEYIIETTHPGRVFDVYTQRHGRLRLAPVDEETTGHVVLDERGDEVDRGGNP
jgi:hypothetical protein